LPLTALILSGKHEYVTVQNLVQKLCILTSVAKYWNFFPERKGLLCNKQQIDTTCLKQNSNYVLYGGPGAGLSSWHTTVGKNCHQAAAVTARLVLTSPKGVDSAGLAARSIPILSKEHGSTEKHKLQENWLPPLLLPNSVNSVQN